MPNLAERVADKYVLTLNLKALSPLQINVLHAIANEAFRQYARRELTKLRKGVTNMEINRPYLIFVNNQLYARKMTLKFAKKMVAELLARGLKASLSYQLEASK